MKTAINMTIYRTKVKSTEGKIIHLYKQKPSSVTSFDPDVQDGCHVANDVYQRGSPFVCGKPYSGCNDLITHLPLKVTCAGCKS
jgi:hypothetical protein